MVERAPKIMYGYILLACTYVELGRLDIARATIKTALEVAPNYSLKEGARIFAAYQNDEDRNRILDGLRKAGLPEG